MLEVIAKSNPMYLQGAMTRNNQLPRLAMTKWQMVMECALLLHFEDRTLEPSKSSFYAQ